MHVEPKPRTPRTPRLNSPAQVLFASLIGTTIEFFDFYIYATAAVLVFPKLFFPASDPAAATLASLATFAIAFFARPIGSAVFGHFGDRVGRKTTLVAALLTMGLSTVTIGLLPTYGSIGVLGAAAARVVPVRAGARARRRMGRRRAARDRERTARPRAWYGMFPQLGAPIGFICSAGIFLLLSAWLTDAQFFQFGWRIPFLASAALVLIGLYVRLTITETPVFREAVERRERVQLPIMVVCREYPGRLVVGIAISLATFVLFYLMTVFALTWGTSALGFSRQQFLLIQLFGIVFFALTIPLSAVLADRYGRRGTLLWTTVAIGVFGFVLAPMLTAGTAGAMCDDGNWPVADGADLRPAGHSALGAVSDGGALYRKLADLQSCRDLRRVARPLRRDVAGEELRSPVCRLLSDTCGGADAPGGAGRARNAGSRSARRGATLRGSGIYERQGPYVAR